MSKEWMEGGTRRNSFLDMMNAAQVCTLAIRVTLQEVQVIETCLMNIWEGRKPKNIYGKAATTALNALQLLFWPHLCKEDPWTVLSWLSPLTGSQKRVSDGTDTQVRGQMINKCRIKMIPRELYNVRDPLWGKDQKIH